MLLSELAEKELIEMENGVRYGYLSETECLFDPKTGKIYGFELDNQSSKMPFQRKKPLHHYLFRGKRFILLERIVYCSAKHQQVEGSLTNEK